MTEPKGTPEGDGHEERVKSAFDDLHAALGDRLHDEAREPLEGLRDAAVRRDAPAAQERLSEVKERHSWLYEELVKHPGVAAVVDELALWGF